ncbi:hypothetical protein ACHAQF_009206 [Verticillium nonalfalfae]|uniref:Uncharacterized protein n=2 Tax=Verticillium TaxID=1036719 RepID=G2X548_VERDV|nr:uncharacterized protein VDAG_05280 [Verticillium dahliae VdLs.17]EGY23842.1 hypothetical protein VDAG_05280 [Verticillium dahliae VdLs.17]PNH41394.1 hypothetical protein VD0004_g5728 [Verticillium dahliae]
MEEKQALQVLQKELDKEVDEAPAIDLVCPQPYPTSVNQASAYINRRSPRGTPASYLIEFLKN